MNLWDQRAAQYRNVARAAITIAVVLVFTYLADEDRDIAGWLFVVALALVAITAAVLIVRRLR